MTSIYPVCRAVPEPSPLCTKFKSNKATHSVIRKSKTARREQKILCASRISVEEARAFYDSMDHPWKKWVLYEPPFKPGGTSSQITRRIVGMGTWQLRGAMYPEFEFLESEIEGLWRQMMQGFGFFLSPERYRFVDSLDPDGSKGEAFTRSVGSPKPGTPGYPRMFIENRLYCGTKFRKVHMELGCRQDGLQVLHCVMYPRFEYDLPIFAVDMVGMRRISLAFADLCPTTKDTKLPAFFEEGLALLQNGAIQSNRTLPEWAEKLSSGRQLCLCPRNDEESLEFLGYVALLTKLYIKSSEVAQPLQSEEEMKEREEAQRRFCLLNQQNSKTVAALTKSFGAEFAETYLKDFLFPIDWE